MKKIIYTGLLGLASQLVVAQQTFNFNQYFNNPYLFSSAYAGRSENPSIWLHHRNQMLGVKGAPTTSLVTVDRALPDFKIGMGLQAYVDNSNIFQRTGATASFSYNLPIANEQYLRFGLGAGVVSNAINYNYVQATDISEIQAFYNIKPVMSFNSDFGLVYVRKQLDVAIAGSNLFNKQAYGDKTQLSYVQKPVYSLLAKYKFPINENWTISPWLNAKTSQGLPITGNLTVLLNWKDKFYAGPTYDARSAVGAAVGIKYNDYKFGYNYGYPTGILAKVSAGIHEISLSFTFRHTNSDLADTMKLQPRVRNNSSRNGNANVVVNNNLAQKDTTVHIVVFKNENGQEASGVNVDALKKILMGDKLTIEPKITNGKIDEKNLERLAAIEKEKGKTGHPEAFNTIYPFGKADVVIAAFLKFENAKALQKAAQRHGLQTSIIKNDFMFYNSTKEVTGFVEALEEVNRLKKLNLPDLIYGSIWLYGK